MIGRQSLDPAASVELEPCTGPRWWQAGVMFGGGAAISVAAFALLNGLAWLWPLFLFACTLAFWAICRRDVDARITTLEERVARAEGNAASLALELDMRVSGERADDAHLNQAFRHGMRQGYEEVVELTKQRLAAREVDDDPDTLLHVIIDVQAWDAVLDERP